MKMKKRIKSWIALALVAVMAFSLAPTALADGEQNAAAELDYVSISVVNSNLELDPASANEIKVTPGANGLMVIVVEANVAGEGTTAVYSGVSGESSNVSVTVDGDVASEADGMSVYAAYAAAQEAGALSMAINGDVSAASEGEWTDAYAIYEEAYSKGDVSVEVTGDIAASADEDAYGVYAYTEGGALSATVTGDITAKDAEYGYGVYETAVNDGAINAEITGDVTVKGPDCAYGVCEQTYYGGTASTKVTGDITAESDEYAYGVYAYADDGGAVSVEVTGDIAASASEDAYGVYAYTEGGTLSATVTGDITAESDEYAYGVYANAYNGGVFKAEITGDVAASSADDDVYAVYASGGSGAVDILVDGNVSAKCGDDGATVYVGSGSTVEVTGNVTMKGEYWNTGIEIQAYSGETEVTVGGGVDVDGFWAGRGIRGCGYSKSNATVTVEHDVFATGDMYTYGVDYEMYGGSAEVRIGGDVTATGVIPEEKNPAEWLDNNDYYVYGVRAENDGGEFTATIGGDVTATMPENAYGEAYGIYSEAGEGGIIWKKIMPVSNESEAINTITVQGDVYGDTAGLYLTGAGEHNITIEGTLSGGLTPIFADESTVDWDNVSLTVWKVEVPEELLEDQNNAELIEQLNEVVDYIIRVNQPKKGAKIKLDGAEEKGDYLVAKADQTVKVKISVSKNYKVTGAFDKGTGKEVPLEKGADGNYYVVVPVGGGVELGLKVRYIAPAPALLVEVNGTEEENAVQNVGKFFEDGSVEFVLGSLKEKATFEFVDGKLIVKNAKGVEMEIIEDEDPAKGGRLEFHFASDPEKVVVIEIDAETLAMLKAFAQAKAANK